MNNYSSACRSFFENSLRDIGSLNCELSKTKVKHFRGIIADQSKKVPVVSLQPKLWKKIPVVWHWLTATFRKQGTKLVVITRLLQKLRMLKLQ